MKLNLLRCDAGKFANAPFDPAVTTRVCSCCKQEKCIDLFGPAKTGLGGIKSRCRKCQSDASNRYNKMNPERVRRNNRAVFVRRFGLTLDEYEAMLEAQGRACAMCGSTEPGGRGSFPVDHCHKSGAVRGIICTNCNLVLGQARDDIAILEKAIEYLKRTSGNAIRKLASLTPERNET